MKTILLLIGTAALVACTPDAPSGPMGPPGGMTCETYDEDTCTGEVNDPKITVDLDKKTIKPECIKSKRNKDLKFKIEATGDIEKGSVGIFPKYPEQDDWLTGENDPNKNQIKIRVPEKDKDKKKLPAKKYSYGIYTPDWCFDPRVEVVD